VNEIERLRRIASVAADIVPGRRDATRSPIELLMDERGRMKARALDDVEAAQRLAGDIVCPGPLCLVKPEYCIFGEDWYEIHGDPWLPECVEGSAEQMCELALAIRLRDGYRRKRCAMQVVGDRARFTNPRNSVVWVTVPLAEVDKLAELIRQEMHRGP